MADYIPGPDADFQAWVANFVTYASANMAALGLVPADLTPISSAQTTFNADFADHFAARAAAQAAKQAKDQARAALTANIRPLVRRLQASTQVTDAEKAALGITVRDAEPSPIGPPTTAPLVSIECGNRLQHTLRFVDSATPTRKAKPPGTLGVEIWNHVGDAPPTEADLRFVAVDTSAPFVLNYNSADGGRTAYYWLRWVSPTGERGPWSEQAQATIAA